jgi:hypothetical protein
VRCSKLELEGELDGAGAADLVEGVEAAVCAYFTYVQRRVRRPAKCLAGLRANQLPEGAAAHRPCPAGFPIGPKYYSHLYQGRRDLHPSFEV